VDKRGSGWSSRPYDADRLACIAEDLAALQDDITQLIRILPARLEAGQRTARGVFSHPAWSGEPSATPGRGRLSLRFPSGPVGRVEEQLYTLRLEADRLLGIMGMPRRPRPQGPPRTASWRPEQAGRSRGDTTLVAAPDRTPSGGQADGDAGDDTLSSDLNPTKGPGGSGPQHKAKPEIVEPKPPGFGF
jgi:hypothetical protein